MLIKAFGARMFIFQPLFLLLGFLLALVVQLPIHELLHAVVFPKGATVHIGMMPRSFAAVALCSYPMRRSRFISMSLLPVVLGIVPFVYYRPGFKQRDKQHFVYFYDNGIYKPLPRLFQCLSSPQANESGLLLAVSQR